MKFGQQADTEKKLQGAVIPRGDTIITCTPARTFGTYCIYSAVLFLTQTTVKLITEDSNVIRSIGIGNLDLINDKVEFNRQFNRTIDSLNTLKIMKSTEIITTFKIRIQKVQRDFQNEYKELKANNFQAFKDRHVNFLSDLIISIQNELQTIQRRQIQHIENEREQTPFGEYYLNFRTQITQFFKRMAADVDNNFAACSLGQFNQQCQANGLNENTENGSKPSQSIFKKLKKEAEKVESRVREKTNRVKNSLYPNIEEHLAAASHQVNPGQSNVPNYSQPMNTNQQQYYPTASQPPFNPYFNPNSNQQQTYSQYSIPGQTYPHNTNYPTNINHGQPPPPYEAIHNQYINY